MNIASSYPAAEGQSHPITRRQTKCQDALFAPLFYVDIAAIVVLAAILGKDALENNNNSDLANEYDGYLKACSVAISEPR